MIIIGWIIVLASIYTCMMLTGQKPSDYFDLASIIVVVGGSVGSALIGSKLINVFKIPIFYLQALLPLSYKIGDIVVTLQRMADKTRQGGIPSLTSEIPVAFDEYTKRAIKLLVAGTDSHVVQSIMEAEIAGVDTRHKGVIAFLDSLGGYFPAFGMLGTVLGIVQAMGNIDDVSQLGTALAIALLTTLYGVFGSNVLILPVSGKLKRKHEEEMLLKTLIMEGLLAVQAGETSQMVGNRMKAICSEGQRSAIEGGKGLSKKKGEKHIELTTYMNALDQEKSLAFMAEVKSATEAKEIGQDDVKQLLAQLINEADDKVLVKDFANEFMKLKTTKKLPKGSKMKGKRKGGAKAGKKGKKAKKVAADDDE